MRILELFEISVAKSKGNEDYDSGNIPFVTNTTLNNGIIKYVEPYDDDRLFPGGTICISGLGFATLQLNEYLPKGNGGDSATILKPLVAMTTEELVYYTAVFNLLHHWRFSFGRKASKNRIKSLDIPTYEEYEGQFRNDFEGFVNIFKSKIEEKEALMQNIAPYND